MQAYLDKILESYLMEMDFSIIPTLEEMTKDIGVSEQTIRRRFANLEYGSYRGFIKSLRDSMISVIRDSNNISGLNIDKVLGFDCMESVYRYIRSNYNCTPKDIFGSHHEDLKHVYIFEFPNGAIKFGVSVNPFIRVGSHSASYLSGNNTPISSYCTGLMNNYSDVESKLIYAYSNFAIGNNREWISGVSFDDVKDSLQLIIEGMEVSKQNNINRRVADLRSSASEQAKQAGLNSLAELIRLTGLPERTVHDWHKHNQTKFQLAIDAALYRKIQNGIR